MPSLPATVDHPVVLRELEVLRVTDISPRMRRITFGGAQLGAFSRDGLHLPAFVTAAPDDHVKVFFARNGQREPVLPRQDDGHLDWPHDGPRPIHRDYTVRRFDAAVCELDLDFVRHERGAASKWAERATPGMRLHITGPPRSQIVPDGVDWYLLIGDETALPAIGRWLEELPVAAAATAIIEVADAAEEQPIQTAANIRWLHRDGADAGTNQLETAVRALVFPSDNVYVWGAGETGIMRPIRRYLRTERGLPKERVALTGYWKHAPAATVAGRA